jgi:hypothetical protein
MRRWTISTPLSLRWKPNRRNPFCPAIIFPTNGARKQLGPIGRQLFYAQSE